jgi:hypothetical protein
VQFLKAFPGVTKIPGGTVTKINNGLGNGQPFSRQAQNFPQKAAADLNNSSQKAAAMADSAGKKVQAFVPQQKSNKTVSPLSQATELGIIGGAKVLNTAPKSAGNFLDNFTKDLVKGGVGFIDLAINTPQRIVDDYTKKEQEAGKFISARTPEISPQGEKIIKSSLMVSNPLVPKPIRDFSAGIVFSSYRGFRTEPIKETAITAASFIPVGGLAVRGGSLAAKAPTIAKAAKTSETVLSGASKAKTGGGGAAAGYGSVTGNINKVMSGLDSKLVPAGILATGAGVGYEAYQRDLLHAPEIPGSHNTIHNPELPTPRTQKNSGSKSGYLPNDIKITGPARQFQEIKPGGYLEGRSLKIRQDVSGKSSNPLVQKANSIIDSTGIGGSIGLPEAFKDQNKIFPSGPTGIIENPIENIPTPTVPDKLTKSKKKDKTSNNSDNAYIDSPAPFDFITPVTPSVPTAKTGGQSGSSGGSSSISPSMPKPTQPVISITMPGQGAGSNTQSGNMPTSAFDFKPDVGSGATDMPGNTATSFVTPLTTIKITPSVPSTSTVNPADTINDDILDDLTRTRDSLNFEFLNKSNTNTSRRKKKKTEWPGFGGPKLKGINMASRFNEWFITNPVPGMNLGLKSGKKGNVKGSFKPINPVLVNPLKSGKTVRGPKLPKFSPKTPTVRMPKPPNTGKAGTGRTTKKKSRAVRPPDFRRFKL